MIGKHDERKSIANNQKIMRLPVFCAECFYLGYLNSLFADLMR